MTLSPDFHAYAAALWQARRQRLGKNAPRWEKAIASAGEDGPLMQYMAGAVPLSDLGEYPPALFAGFARHAHYVREAFPWCKSLPEPLFLTGVAAPRINTEELEDCRALFCQELAPLVQGLTLPEAIQAVNRWCAGHVAYRPTDARTSSPLAIYRRGWGRCGEESTFAVTALRSVGICARQVYAPWWSHCDDNHAWVEAWDGSAWRYLGACEPEPELDRGWFTGAAARAMLVHTRAFVGDLPAPPWLFPGTDPIDLHTREGIACETLTARYAPTRLCTVALGQGGAGARLTFSILNMASPRPIAHRQADGQGIARLRLGLGSVHVTAEKDGRTAEALWDTRQTSRLTLNLENAPLPETFLFAPPAPPESFPLPLTPRQKAQREATLAEAASRREAWIKSQPLPPAGGFAARVLTQLTEKDRAAGLPPEIEEDCKKALPWEDAFPADVFSQYLLSPRVGLEPLRPFRGSAKVVGSPRLLWQLIGEQTAPLPGYSALPQSPRSALTLGAAGEQGKRTLFCALCRAMGTPARLSPLDGAPEYWEDGTFKRAGAPATARLRLLAPQTHSAACGQNYTLSRWTNGAWQPLSTGDIPAGKELALSLPPGAWRLYTVVRLPDGSQLCRQTECPLSTGQEKIVPLVFQAAASAQLLQSLPLPPFSLWDPAGQPHPSTQLLAQAPHTLFCWLEPGREPTEHLLLELQEAARTASLQACTIYLLTPAGESSPALTKLKKALPNARFWQGDFSELPALSRQLFLDPERLPLVLLATPGGRGLYAFSGYNVGAGPLLARLIEAAGANTQKEEP